MKSVTYTLEELKNHIKADLHGDPAFLVTGVASLQNAKPGQLTFFHDSRYKKLLKDSQASAIILAENLSPEVCPIPNRLIIKNPQYAFAQVTGLFQYQPTARPGIHPTAIIGHDCHIAKSASIGAHCVIGDRVTIGENTILHPGCSIGDDSALGDNVCLWSHVTIYYGVKVANQVIVHSGAVIGADGFGMVHNQGTWHKVPQIGGVVIGNKVEIGANTTVDRGALDDTIIEDGVKLDNQIQIGHNVHIGAHTVIAACTAIGGSTKIGKYCMIGGAVAINDHIEIADQVILTAAATVSSSIKTAGIYSSGIPVQENRIWRKNAVRFTQLDEIVRRLSQAENPEK